MKEIELQQLLEGLVKQPNETEWLEFKLNFHSAEEIGKLISALSNSASLQNQPFGYLVFGVVDKTHEIKGTTFKIKSYLHKKDDLENWLVNRLRPKIDFETAEFDYKGNHISMITIPATNNEPVSFLNCSYIRVNSITRRLNEFPDKARKIWSKAPKLKFEEIIAKKNISASDIVKLLDTSAYFDLLNLPYPSNRDAVIEKFVHEKLIQKNRSNYNITNLGAILFAKNLDDFEGLWRKAVRVIVYEGKDKLKTLRDEKRKKGYAIGFKGLIDWLNSQLPANEVISTALRKDVRMYPKIAIRELVANSIIHQNFEEKGFTMIEIFNNRIEISNPGIPLINPDRFIDEYQSRNERLADLMRRLGICEEKGSGIDRVISQSEFFQLPAPNFVIQEVHTKATLFAYLTLNEMEKKDKVRTCYQHCCLKYVTNEKMTNQSLRDRFKIDTKNAAIASRIIRDTIEAEFIKDADPSTKSRKYVKYVPYWA